MTFNERILEGLDEILLSIKSVRELIASGGIPENEDWQKASRPMHQIVNLLSNYRYYKDQEMVEGENFFVSSNGMLMPKSKSQSEITLEKEERKEWDYPREFKKSERVVYEDKHGVPHKAMVTCDQQSKYEDDEIEIFIFHDEEDDDSQGIEMKFVDVKGVYQLNENGKKCPRCGEPLYDEHLEHMDYPYYCPWCQENFYGIETR